MNWRGVRIGKYKVDTGIEIILANKKNGAKRIALQSKETTLTVDYK